MNHASSDFGLRSRIECIQMSWVLVHQVPGNHCGTRFHNVDSYTGLCHQSQYLTAQVPHGVVSASVVPFPFMLFLLDCFLPTAADTFAGFFFFPFCACFCFPLDVFEFEAVCEPRFMTLWDYVACRRLLVVVNALDRLSISCFFPKI